MLADLALASVAVIEPLEEAILVDEFDATAAGARVLEGVLGVSWITADPTNVFLFVVIVVVVIGRQIFFRRGGGRRRGGVHEGVDRGGDLHEVR